MASGSEVKTLTWTGDGADKVIDATRTPHSINLYTEDASVMLLKMNTMADGDAIDFVAAGVIAANAITFDNPSGEITIKAAFNLATKVFHAQMFS